MCGWVVGLWVGSRWVSKEAAAAAPSASSWVSKEAAAAAPSASDQHVGSVRKRLPPRRAPAVNVAVPVAMLRFRYVKFEEG